MEIQSLSEQLDASVQESLKKIEDQSLRDYGGHSGITLELMFKYILAKSNSPLEIKHRPLIPSEYLAEILKRGLMPAEVRNLFLIIIQFRNIAVHSSDFNQDRIQLLFQESKSAFVQATNWFYHVYQNQQNATLHFVERRTMDLKENKKMQDLSTDNVDKILKRMDRMQKRMDRMQTGIDRIEHKVDSVLDILRALSVDILEIKRGKITTDEKLERIYNDIDAQLPKILAGQEKTIAFYENELSKWLDFWAVLHRSSLTFLVSAEFIFEKLPSSLDTDFSPCIIQYCRALENEILTKLFHAFHEELLRSKIDIKKLVEKDLRNEKTKIFAKNVQKNKRDYTLGNMNFIMSLARTDGDTLLLSPLLTMFREFFLKYFEETILEQDFLKAISKVQSDYRNQSAHPNIMAQSQFEECKVLIREVLSEFLANYKKDAK